MKKTHLYSNEISGANWQLLGELELSVGSDTDSVLIAWLTKTIGPLNLSTDFLKRILASAQNSAARNLHPSDGETWRQIHLSIFAPYERISKQNTWGFFHIERIENRPDNSDARNHAIDFYLYVDGG